MGRYGIGYCRQDSKHWRNLKLLFILPEYLPHSGGGIISYYAGILPILVEAGHEIHVLVTRADLRDLEDCEIEGVRISYLRSDCLRQTYQCFDRYGTNPIFSALLPVAWAAFEQVRHGEGFDLIETTDFDLLFAPWVVAVDVPPVNISLHGSSGQLEWHEPTPQQTMSSDYLRLVERAAVASARGVQTNSELNAGFWSELTRRDIPVLLPILRVPVLQGDFSAPIDSGLVIGRLQLLKGPLVLCHALASVPEAQISWFGRDVVTESGMPMSQKLREQYPQIFGTRLLHRQGISHEQVLREITMASFLCVPSIWDVFNLSVVEAMSLGTPVICSRQAGASMLICHEENGLLFDASRPSELAECIKIIRSMSTTARISMTENARSTIRQRLNPEKLLEERITYYKTVASDATRGFRDEWLESVLAPKRRGSERVEFLKAFTTKELFTATGRQLVQGVRRKFRGLMKNQ